MGAILNTLRALKLWQIGVLAVVLIGAGASVYGVYAYTSGLDQGDLDEGQQLIPVQFGNLVNEVSTNGSLIFPNRETLTFGTQGTVAEVLVEEGQQVVEGQPLASLDAATVASLEKSLAQAQVDLRNAEDRLDKAKDPHSELDLAQAEAGVANARLSLRNAQESLDQVMDSYSEEDIAEARSRAASAQMALANARGDLTLTQREQGRRVQDAEDAFDASVDGYRGVFEKWLGIELGDDEVALDPDALLASWGVDLVALFDTDAGQDIGLAWFSEGPPPDDPTTPWNESVIYAWLNFYPGALAPTCEDGVVPAQGACVRKEMDDAWETYQRATDTLESVQIQAARAIASAEDAVTKAEDGLGVAQEALADLEAGLDSLEVDVKKKQVAVAQATLTEAEEALAELNGSVDPLEVALREAEVASAQAALEEASERLEGATLRAPMAGVVAVVNVEAGQNVNANTPAIVVTDPTVVEVDGVVDEIDVLFIREGAAATVVMDALPGEVLQGTVSSIASSGLNQQGVVSYPLRIAVRVPEGVELREGLSATASIIIREDTNVLLVPNQALYGSFDQPVVRVMTDEGVVERPVTLGNSDGFWTVVVQGLQEGERVVMETSQATTDQLGAAGAIFRQFRGGLGGGGGFGGGGGGRRRAPQGQNR